MMHLLVKYIIIIITIIFNHAFAKVCSIEPCSISDIMSGNAIIVNDEDNTIIYTRADTQFPTRPFAHISIMMRHYSAPYNGNTVGLGGTMVTYDRFTERENIHDYLMALGNYSGSAERITPKITQTIFPKRASNSITFRPQYYGMTVPGGNIIQLFWSYCPTAEQSCSGYTHKIGDILTSNTCPAVIDTVTRTSWVKTSPSLTATIGQNGNTCSSTGGFPTGTVTRKCNENGSWGPITSSCSPCPAITGNPANNYTTYPAAAIGEAFDAPCNAHPDSDARMTRIGPHTILCAAGDTGCIGGPLPFSTKSTCTASGWVKQTSNSAHNRCLYGVSIPGVADTTSYYNGEIMLFAN